MRNVALTTAAVFTVVVALVACEEQAPEKTLTAPDALSFARPIGGACDDGRARLIGTQQGDLYARPALDSARARFALVTGSCATSAGKSLMLDYIQWTIDNRGLIKTQTTGTKEGNLLVHWNTVFPYVGYTGADQPASVPTSIFSVDGAVSVIDGNATGEIRAANAALTSYPQDSDGDQRDHLFVIYPIAPNCLTGTNLRQSGPCFQFSAFPHVSPKFSPKVKVGICQPLQPGEGIPLSSPALGHLDPVTRITENAGVYPQFCGDVSSVPPGAWNAGVGSMLKRLAWQAKRVLTPEPLYAVHGGLGGLGGGLSPFGAADRKVFDETFADDAVGQSPVNADPGTWTSQVKNPGSILVQNSLGQRNSKLVVLDQSGGNCAKCFGLLLQGSLFTASSAATEGIYDIDWISLQDNANMKEAVFVLRDSGGRDIARLTYAVRNNTKLILYNDTKTTPGTFVTNWVQHVPRQFKVRVDLDAKTTTLYLDGNPVAGAEGVPFVNTGAANLATVAADFRGIDSGIMGWDEIRIERLADVNN